MSCYYSSIVKCHCSYSLWTSLSSIFCRYSRVGQRPPVTTHGLISVSLLQSGTGQPPPPSLTLGLKLSMWRCRKSCQRNFTTPGVLIVKVQLGTFNQFLLQLYWRWCLYLLRMWITLWTGITLKTGITSTRTNTESQNLLPSRTYQRVWIKKVSICFKRNEWSITVNCKVKVSWIIPL